MIIPDYVTPRYVIDDARGRPWYGIVDNWSHDRLTKEALDKALEIGAVPRRFIVTHSVYLLTSYRYDPFTMGRVAGPVVRLRTVPHSSASLAEKLSWRPLAGPLHAAVIVAEKDLDPIYSGLAAEIAAEQARLQCDDGQPQTAARPATCPDCRGKKVYEGLIFDRYDCPTCNGTGKV